MNDRIRKLFISTVAVCCSVLLLFPISVRNVHADNQSDIMYIFNNPFIWSKSTYNSYSYRLRFGLNSTNSLVTPISSDNPNSIYMLKYKIYNGSWYTLFYTYMESGTIAGTSGVNSIRLDRTADKINYALSNTTPMGSYYTYNDGSSSGKRVVYTTIVDSSSQGASIGYLFNNYNCPDSVPRILLKENQNEDSILGVISSENFDYLPWNGTTSSGGVYFDDGTTLDPENTSKYTQIYNSMDVNQDNSVSIAEVNYYNQTYNTNYDYSAVNNDNDFTAMEFLYWVATQINDGNENPGGGTGSGGGSSAVGGGISIGDGSFTQTQTQTIEENAVNVTVNNDNNLNQENTQWLNSIINNNVGGEEQQNAFENAIGSISGFTGIARSFAGLAGAVLSFLPSWVTVLLGVMFAILFVFIVFRLIHLFI